MLTLVLDPAQPETLAKRVAHNVEFYFFRRTPGGPVDENLFPMATRTSPETASLFSLLRLAQAALVELISG